MEEKKEEEKKEEEKKEKKEEEPKPPSPCVLSVDMHCVGCAKKIERSILKIRGTLLPNDCYEEMYDLMEPCG